MPTSSAQADQPPVPLNVLLPPATTRHVSAPDAGTDRTGLTSATAARLVGVYTRPGDRVLDLHGTGLIAAAAARAGRHATTLVTTPHDADTVQAHLNNDLQGAHRALARTVVAATGTSAPRPIAAASTGRAHLLVTRLPLDPASRMGLRAAGRWLDACRTALAPGGWLLAAVDPAGPGGTFGDCTTTVIVAARAAGFTYHQHLVTVTRDLIPPDHPGQPPALLSPGGRHERIHADLLVFAA